MGLQTLGLLSKKRRPEKNSTKSCPIVPNLAPKKIVPREKQFQNILCQIGARNDTIGQDLIPFYTKHQKKK